ARAKARADKIDALDDAVPELAVELLLDDERPAVLDDLDRVRDAEAVGDLLGLRVDEPQLRDVPVPDREECRSLRCAGPLPQAAWDEGSQLHGRGEARCERGFVPRSDRLDELRADGRRRLARRDGDRPAVAEPEVEGLASVLLCGTFAALRHDGEISRGGPPLRRRRPLPTRVSAVLAD